MIRNFFRWLVWLARGKPVVSYPGFHCGICGRWVWEDFDVPEYLSAGKDSDTWGVCPGCMMHIVGEET